MFDDEYEEDQQESQDDEIDLFSAVSEGDADEVLMLVNGGIVDIDEVNEDGDTVLHLAVAARNLDIVSILIREGDADITIKNNQHDTPLHIAATSSRPDMVYALLERREKSRNDHHHTALCETALAKKDRDGNTPLHVASALGNVEVVRYLLQNGADVSMRNREGATAMELAISHGVLNVVKLLIKGGNSVAERDIDGHSLLHQAAIYGRNQIVKWLVLSAGADLYEENGYEQTALFLALKHQHLSTAQLLLNLGAGIKTDLTDMDLSLLAMKNCVLIGAEVKGEPIRIETAINDSSELKKALLRGEPLNAKALRKAVAARVQSFPDDEQLKQAWHSLAPRVPRYSLSPIPAYRPRPAGALTETINTCKGP